MEGRGGGWGTLHFYFIKYSVLYSACGIYIIQPKKKKLVILTNTQF